MPVHHTDTGWTYMHIIIIRLKNLILARWILCSGNSFVVLGGSLIVSCCRLPAPETAHIQKKYHNDLVCSNGEHTVYKV